MPMLLPPETSAPPDETSAHVDNKAAFYLALAFLALFQAGRVAPVVSATGIMENVLCQRRNDYLGDCKGEAVQSELAMLKGIASLAFLISGIFLTVPFGALADRYGTRRIMAILEPTTRTSLHLFTHTVAHVLDWMAPTWPIELMWATLVFFVFSGEPPAFVSLLFNFVADATPPTLRSAWFFQLEAAAYMGSIVSFIVSSALADADPWSFSKAAYIVSLDSAFHLVVLFLLPGVAALFSTRFSLSSATRDWWLARASVLLTVVGCAGIPFSSTPALMALSVVLLGLGAGYSSSMRGLLTSLTNAPHRSLVLSIMSTLDIMGTLIGGPLAGHISRGVGNRWAVRRITVHSGGNPVCSCLSDHTSQQSIDC